MDTSPESDTEIPVSISDSMNKLIEGKYTLCEKLGVGGYGTVYRALSPGGSVAIKRLIHGSEHGLRCVIEPIIMSSVKHRCLVPALEILSNKDCTCIVMPLAVSDASHYIKKTKVELSKLIHWCWNLCQGLAVLHRLKIIHGDIKASNLLIMDNESAKLGDFTLSVYRGSEFESVRHTVCTFTHRPPEVFMADASPGWTNSVDVWALGCTIYELIYDRTLFPYQGDIKHPTEDETLTPKALASLREWGLLTHQSVAHFSVKKNIKYRSPTFYFHETSEYKLINDLILSLLKLDPDDRPEMSSVLAHPLFRNTYSITPYYIKCAPDSVDWRIDLGKLTNSLPHHVCDYIHYLWAIVNLKQPLPLEHIWGCVLLAIKITHTPLVSTPPHSWAQVVAYEQTICNLLNWQFPL